MKRVTAIKWGTEEMGSPRLAAMGKIKIGGKGDERISKAGGKYRLPVKYSHFVITSKERGPDGNFKPDVDLMKSIEASGKPMEIPIILMYDSVEKNFPHRLACYDGQTLWCQGNGEHASRRNNGGWASRTCPCELLRTADGKKNCKPNGHLAAVIRDAPQVGAVYEYTTTSWETVRNIVSSLMHIQTITGGILAGIPLTLVMYPSTDRIDTASGTATNLNYKVAITFKGGYRDLAEGAQMAAKNRLAARVDMKALEGGRADELTEDLTEEEQTDMVEEFYPETIAGEAVSGDVVDVEIEPEAAADETKPPAGTTNNTGTLAPPDGPGTEPASGEPDAREQVAAHIQELGEAMGKPPGLIKAAITGAKSHAALIQLGTSWEEMLRASGGEDKGGAEPEAQELPATTNNDPIEPDLGF